MRENGKRSEAHEPNKEQSFMASFLNPLYQSLTDTENPKKSHSLLYLHHPSIITMATLSRSNSTLSPSPRRPPYIPSHIPDPFYVRILDTTLRDGEQAPGASMNSEQKLDIARQLAKLGVDIIDAGFPAASDDDFETVKSIAQVVGNAVDDDGYVPVICGTCRCSEKEIRSAWEAVKYAKRPRIQTFIATSAIVMECMLRKSKEQVVEIARSMVKFARSLGCDDVGFTAQDATSFPLHNFFFFFFHLFVF